MQTSIPRTHPVAIRARYRLAGALLLIGDMAAAFVAAYLGAELWGLFNARIDPVHYYKFFPALFMLPVAYMFGGLYSTIGVNPVEELRQLSVSTTLVYLVFALAIFLTQDAQYLSRGIFLCAWALSVVALPLGRTFTRFLFASQPWWGVPVLILGAGKTAALLIERFKSQPGLGVKPVVCLDDDPAKYGACAGVPVAGPIAQAPVIARELGIRHAIVAMPGVKRERLIGLLNRYAATFPHLTIVPDLFGMASLPVTARDIGGMLSLQARQNLLLPLNRMLKRSLDLALIIPFGLLALPIIGIAALWIRLVSRGAPFYAQLREGQGGETLHVWKLRTMYQNADELLERHLTTDPGAKAEWERFFKLRNDPRILPGVGQLLRKTSLDELPQLWNIVKGEMSLVGPRPFPYYHLEKFSPEFRALRREVLPGLTGLWQVSERSEGDLEVQETLDSYYIRNWSLWLDLYLLARTPWAVLFGKGAY